MARVGGKDRGIIEKPKGSKKFYVRMWHEGRERLFGPFIRDKQAARNFYQKAKTEQREARFFPEQYQRRRRARLTVGIWIDECLGGCTVKSRSAWERFGKWWKGEIGRRPLTDVTTSELKQIRRRELDRWEQALQRIEAGERSERRPRGPSTINRHFDFLRHIYYLALQDEKVTRNPLARFGRLPEPDGPDRVLSEDEEAALAIELDPLDFDAVTVALQTGMRQREQFRLKKSQIVWARREAVLSWRGTKTKRARRVPLNDTAIAALRRLCAASPTEYVFPSPTNPARPRHPTAFYNRVFKPALAAVQIEGVTWHTLRHTTATRLLATKQVSARTIMDIMGWTRPEMLQRYTHLIDQLRHDAIRLLDRPVATGNETGKPTAEHPPQPTANPA